MSDKPKSLRESIEDLRTIDATWKYMDDPIGELKKIREDPAYVPDYSTAERKHIEALQAQIATLTAKLEELEGERGWRDIASAPKDRTAIIVYASDMVGEARWTGDGTSEGWWWAGEDPGDYHAEKISSEPTHWQPLPTPPIS